ncbi:hypothetical protein M2139_000714 [Enterococcus sp. PF1-24]|uniref:GPP34 family phosphoprotein n=1 Tax=unclassified Enterococcus TaxID=2608891 RepID=UPI002476A22F|nr:MULTISPECIES: GPP34 family phosphoprotein [unclassified Enterococcus]MDH6363597.1 hypothetical protein [Enterococcus sp. PFB1-1]MDH6400832.1 hypothetical protein [Enterococcus sp. PF1-24]
MNLALSQKITLLTLKPNGKNFLDKELAQINILAAALYDLKSSQHIDIDKSSFTILKENLDDSLIFLTPLFETLKNLKKKKLKQLTNSFNFSLTNKPGNQLVASLKASLVENNLATSDVKQSLLGKEKTIVLPETSQQEMLVAEIKNSLTTSQIAEDELILLALFTSSRLAKNYFNSEEMKTAKKVIKTYKDNTSYQSIKTIIDYHEATVAAAIVAATVQV